MHKHKKLIFVLGGARSGKSDFAQSLAEQSAQRVAYIATAQAGDEEMKQRILAHQKARPAHWRTIEAPLEPAKAIREQTGDAEVVLLDCLTLLITNLLLNGPDESDEQAAFARVDAELTALLAALHEIPAHAIVVSNEVGQGVVPAYPLGRLFRDLQGYANKRCAQQADEVYWTVAGLPIEIKASGIAQAKSLNEWREMEKG